MASFQTFYRTIVMLATLGLVAKAWFLYGPSVDEMKTIGTRVAEVASQTWSEYWQQPANNALADDPRSPRVGAAPAPFVPLGRIESMPHEPYPAAPPTGTGMVQLAGGTRTEIAPASPASPELQEDGRLSAVLERLTELGVRDQELAPWGSRGELMRFSCSLSWANSPAYRRHFEAVAVTPLLAAEQVAAEIEAWRNGQR